MMEFLSENETQSFGEQDSESNQRTKRTRKRTPRKITGDWPDYKVFKLISLVKQRPLLYDSSFVDHKTTKDQFWKYVAHVLDDNDWAGCRTKWQSLRVTFNTNLRKSKKKKKSFQGKNEPVLIRWKFFDSMRFLEEDYNSIESPSIFLYHNVEETNNEIPITTESQNQLSPNCYDADTQTQLEGTSKNTEKDENPHQAMNGCDEFAAFGSYIAAELRRLSRKDSRRLKSRLTRTLLEFWDEQEELST